MSGKPYGVPLTRLTEREAPGGGRMLTGRLGAAVVIGLPMDNDGGPMRWQLTLLQPTRTTEPRQPRRQREADRHQLAGRALAATDAATRNA